TQPVNAGKVENRGVEISGEYQLLRRAGLSWSLNAAYAYNRNMVLDLAGEPFMILDRFGTRIVEGFPVAGKWERVTIGVDENGFAIPSDTAHYIGPSIPPHTGNFGTTLAFGN